MLVCCVCVQAFVCVPSGGSGCVSMWCVSVSTCLCWGWASVWTLVSVFVCCVHFCAHVILRVCITCVCTSEAMCVCLCVCLPVHVYTLLVCMRSFRIVYMTVCWKFEGLHDFESIVCACPSAFLTAVRLILRVCISRDRSIAHRPSVSACPCRARNSLCQRKAYGDKTRCLCARVYVCHCPHVCQGTKLGTANPTPRLIWYR